MSCSPFDLGDYFFKALSASERRQVELHTSTCAFCREELERLRLTQAALVSLGEEEIPQRLAFVSDQVFEPSRWRSAWSMFWASSVRVGFAAAIILSVGLIVFTFGGQARTDGKIQAAVDRAVAASEARLEQRMVEAAAQSDYYRRRELVLERSSYGDRR